MMPISIHMKTKMIREIAASHAATLLMYALSLLLFPLYHGKQSSYAIEENTEYASSS